MSVFSFFTDTREETVKRGNNEHQTADIDKHDSLQTPDQTDDEDGNRRPNTRGRPRNQRVKYTDTHPARDKKIRIVRTIGHNNIPNFVGQYFAKRHENDELNDFFYASMLLLLKPWRNLATDLKPQSDTWHQTFHNFFESASIHTKNIIENIQFFHTCHAAANAARDNANGDIDVFNPTESVTEPNETMNEFLADENHDDTAQSGGIQMTEEALLVLKNTLRPQREDEWGHLAVSAAQGGRLLPYEKKKRWNFSVNPALETIQTPVDLSNLQYWQGQITHQLNLQIVTVHGLDPASMTEHHSRHRNRQRPRVEILPDDDMTTNPPVVSADDPMIEVSLPTLDVSELKPDQRRAFAIVQWHLNRTLSMYSLDPHNMILMNLFRGK